MLPPPPPRFPGEYRARSSSQSDVSSGSSDSSDSSDSSARSTKVQDPNPFLQDRIIRLIYRYLFPTRSQGTCGRYLSINKKWFEIGGEYLFKSIVLRDSIWKEEVFKGLEIKDGPAIKKIMPRNSTSKGKRSKPIAISFTRRNFKKRLVQYCKYLTIHSHHFSGCRPFENSLDLFPNLKVLRLVPDRDSFTTSGRNFCESPFNKLSGCRFLPNLNPRHIVYRNIGIDGLVTPTGMEYHASKLELVTYVLPTDGRLFVEDGEDLTGLFNDLHNLHRHVDQVKIVFAEDEGLSREVGIATHFGGMDMEMFDGAGVDDIFPIRYENLEDILGCLTGNIKCQYHIFGLDRLYIEDSPLERQSVHGEGRWVDDLLDGLRGVHRRETKYYLDHKIVARTWEEHLQTAWDWELSDVERAERSRLGVDEEI